MRIFIYLIFFTAALQGFSQNVNYVDLGGDKIICEGDSVALDAGVGDAIYIWNTGDTTQTIYATSPGYYEVTVESEEGVFVDGVYVNGPRETGERMANIFTPNGDGLNDIFRPMNDLEALNNFEFKIFNRYGQEIFKSVSPAVGWNGKTMTGENYPAGSYYFLTVYHSSCGKEELSGHLSLVR